MKISQLSLKGLLFSIIITSLILVGCGKKKEESKTQQQRVAVLSDEETLQQETENKEILASTDNETIPLYEEEIEDFDDTLTDFAIAENEEIDTDLKDVNTSTQETFKIADLSQDEEYLKELDELEEDWEDPELLALEEEISKEEEYNLKTVHFEINKHQVKEEDEILLEENIETAKRAITKGKSITILGHCCQLGEASFNMPLSERRASSIKAQLVKNGIPENRIKVIGMGQENPLVWSENLNKEELIIELQPNRRAEFIIN